ncbi:hypothetical protein JR316_0013241 [Psilocybe cubensis]|uniref:Uncharacterized protein n=2 Tax=Psilocybe cubensis TaxID=181762 RepID=A0A8H7XS80_PSICU|nr:hypothetical protein JR316_0013241 [Psilocybe cubensis]KAH9474776.1 hypothetical protein JR316_0013241 [Psilocybe cubensis]
MSVADYDALSPVLDLGHQSTMTFLRNEPYLARVHVAAITDAETLNVLPHWHDKYDELFRVIKGRLRVRIGDVTRDYTAEDGEILIPRGTIHSLHGFKGEETIFEERTDPMDGEKELFFRNLLEDGKTPTSLLQVLVVGYQGDMYIPLPGHIKWLEKAFVIIFGGYIAPLFGYKNRYSSYKVKGV